jgi:hypothetical protein
VDGYSFFDRFERSRKQASVRTKLALDSPSFEYGLFFVEAGFAEVVLVRSITIFVISYVAIWAVAERVVLLIVGT